MQGEKKESRPLSLLIAVCDKGNSKKVAQLFEARSSMLNLMTLGKGTASSKILNYLGLGQSEKTVFLSVMSLMEAEDMIYQLEWTLDMKKPGHGIAFTLPLNGVFAKSFVDVAAGSSKTPKTSRGREEEEGEEKEMENRSEYELIIAVTNRGYNQEVMDAARTAKATGGTIINARGFALSDEEKFFGVTLQSEKEIIIILAESGRKNEIMKAIAEKAGVNTPAGTVSFSMQVSDVEGLQPYLAQMEE